MEWKQLASWQALFLAALGVGCGGNTSGEELTPSAGTTSGEDPTPSGGGSSGAGIDGSVVETGGTQLERCEAPTQVLPTDTGYFRCAQGFYHRTAASRFWNTLRWRRSRASSWSCSRSALRRRWCTRHS